MDEPLSNLDAALSRRLRGEILRLHAELGFTLVYVTHGREEAQEIGTRMIELGESRALYGPFSVHREALVVAGAALAKAVRSGLIFPLGT